eukprot:gene849-1652_t
MAGSLNIAIQGCCHGELDSIYEAIRCSETKGVKVDLLLICGDFECIRDYVDLECVAVPPKYRRLNTFHLYLSGQKVAPVPTIFIGGNHEASNVLQSLYYGGWVAPNIYFLGFAGVVWFGGVRIGGLSGIYNDRHYNLGHFEMPPYDNNTLRSVYHLRELEVYRMAHIEGKLDICMSHDWPAGIEHYGDIAGLLRKKRFLEEDISSGALGSPPLMHLLRKLQPDMWFAAHLHVKYAAIFPHETTTTAPVTSSSSSLLSISPPPPPTPAMMTQTQSQSKESNDNAFHPSLQVTAAGDSSPSLTRFLALDKVLPGRDFLQIISVPRQHEASLHLRYDVQWLAVLRRTHFLLSTAYKTPPLPPIISSISPEELNWVTSRLYHTLGDDIIPPYIPQCLPTYPPSARPAPLPSPITDSLLELLELPHIWTTPVSRSRPPPPVPATTHQTNNIHIATGTAASARDPNELILSDEEEQEGDREMDQDRVEGKLISVQPVPLPVRDEREIDIDDFSEARLAHENAESSVLGVKQLRPSSQRLITNSHHSDEDYPTMVNTKKTPITISLS